MEVEVDPGICPLCGEPNHCHLAAGVSGHERCWCFTVKFPESLLERVPPEARQRACICQKCWAEATKDK